MSFSTSSFSEKLDKAIDHLKHELGSLRTGKASPQLLDSVQVEAYGSKLKITEIASVSAPDPTLLVVTPWDRNVLEHIEKAIMSAGLNMNPVVAGDLIRIAIAPLTQERRLEMVKLLSQKAEAIKAMFRTIRSDVKREIENQKGDGGVSEDDISLDLKEMDDIFKEKTELLEELVSNKEQDLMKV